MKRYLNLVCYFIIYISIYSNFFLLFAAILYNIVLQQIFFLCGVNRNSKNFVLKSLHHKSCAVKGALVLGDIPLLLGIFNS